MIRRIALLLFVILILVIILFTTNKYIYRLVFWNFPHIDDYKRFPYHSIQNKKPTFYFTINHNKENEFASKFKTLRYKLRYKELETNFDELLTSTGTTAFIVIKDDTILCEKYYNGYHRDSINTSFSMAKSVLSLLVGIAIDEGYIKSVDEPITNYLPELKQSVFQKFTIKHLLLMKSGISYKEGFEPWKDEPKTYYYPDLRKLALQVRLDKNEPSYFHYNNYHAQLLGLILERTTRMSVSKYLEEKVWKPLGMEFPASWSTDNIKDGFERMESGINARAIDFVKFGRLLLNKGNCNGQKIVSEKWIIDSTKFDDTSVFNPGYYQYYKDFVWTKCFFNKGNAYYKYFWWGYKINETDYDYFAQGNLGQFIYICPKKNLIIARFGKKWGAINWWPDLFLYIKNNLD